MGHPDSPRDCPAGTRLEKWKERLDKYSNDHNWRIIDALASVAEEVGASPSAVSLAWLVRKPGVTSVIFGARSTAQLDDNLKSDKLELSDAHMEALDDASASEIGYPYEFIRHLSGAW